MEKVFKDVSCAITVPFLCHFCYVLTDETRRNKYEKTAPLSHF
jgi:hypothetical protein